MSQDAGLVPIRSEAVDWRPPSFGEIKMKNVLRGALALVAVALPSLALAAEPLKAACCALCPACGCC